MDWLDPVQGHDDLTWDANGYSFLDNDKNAGLRGVFQGVISALQQKGR